MIDFKNADPAAILAEVNAALDRIPAEEAHPNTILLHPSTIRVIARALNCANIRRRWFKVTARKAMKKGTV